MQEILPRYRLDMCKDPSQAVQPIWKCFMTFVTLVVFHLRLRVNSSCLWRSEERGSMVVPFHQVTVGFGKPYARQYNLAGDPESFFLSAILCQLWQELFVQWCNIQHPMPDANTNNESLSTVEWVEILLTKWHGNICICVHDPCRKIPWRINRENHILGHWCLRDKYSAWNFFLKQSIISEVLSGYLGDHTPSPLSAKAS